MEEYKKNFINFMVDSQVLKFGEFTLKSGRKSPFFMNAGAYKTGSQLIRLGEYYARAIYDKFGLDFDVLFGPAYKGIPLAVATVMAISRLYGRDIKYCANRKEIKDHGDTGILLGTRLRDEDRVLIIEDVTTSGASIADYGFPTGAIVTMDEVQEYLYNKPVNGRVLIDDKIKASLDSYYAEYGVK